MRNLQLESLETRQLLNGNSVSTQLLPSQSPPEAPSTPWITGRFLFIDYGGRPELFGWAWSGEGGMEIGRLRSIAFGGFDGSGRDIRGPQAFSRLSSADTSPAETWSGVSRGSSTYPGADPNFAGSRGTASINFVAPVTAPATAPAAPANNGASGATIPGILLQRLNPQPLSFLENPVGARSLPIDARGLFALRAPVQTPRGNEGLLGYAGSLGEESRQGRLTPGTSTAAGAQQEPVLPSPKVADLLAILPFFDDSALDVGIQQFLEQLERLCPSLTNHADSSALWPWIVAVTAAATAGEIARRELRRPPVASTGERNEIGCFPPDRLFGG